MSSCKDCVHYEVCMDYTTLSESEVAQKFDQVEKICDHFKPKSRFVELPCEVGQTVYDISEFVLGVIAPDMFELKADEMTIEKGAEGGLNFTYDGLYINCEDIGETLFFTKEDAEKALAERSKE